MADKLLLSNGTSFLLLSDGSSDLLLSGAAAGVGADLTKTLAAITLTSDVDVIVGAALTSSVGNITLTSDTDIIVGASLTASIGAITASDSVTVTGEALGGGGLGKRFISEPRLSDVEHIKRALRPRETRKKRKEQAALLAVMAPVPVKTLAEQIAERPVFDPGLVADMSPVSIVDARARIAERAAVTAAYQAALDDEEEAIIALLMAA